MDHTGEDDSGQASPPLGAVRPLAVVTTLLVLFTFALTQPLLDLLGRHAEFFVARQASGLQIVTLVALLTLGVPLAISALVLVVGTVSRAVGAATYHAAVAFLAACWIVQILERVPGVSSARGGLLLAGAVILGVGVAFGLRTSRRLRTIVTLALPVPLLVAGHFLFVSPVAKVVLPPAQPRPAAAAVPNPVPIVMVVFDELPLASLLDLRGGIDAASYPNFARLAADATWFRNATTVDVQTTRAVAAVLDGRYPRPDALPIARDHPRSLFALLGGQYAVHGWEPITRLCPQKACPRTSPKPSLRGRWRSLVSDLSDVGVLAGYLILPQDLTRGLPSIGQGWGGFAGQADGGEDAACTGRARCPSEAAHGWIDERKPQMDAFLESLAGGASGRPALYFLHAVFPHNPWQYLPSGQRYTADAEVAGLDRQQRSRWTFDEWLVTQAYQRHLLQVGDADRFLGRLLRRLHETGLHDRALVVVTADHGAAFHPGLPFRRMHERTFGDIGAVPLFVKLPAGVSGRAGGVDDRPAELVDVLPTIVEVLGDPALAAGSDGASLLSGSNLRRDRKRVNSFGAVFEFDTDGAPTEPVVRRKYRLFGSDGARLDPYDVAPPGMRHLLGRTVAEVATAVGRGARVAGAERLRHVDLEGQLLPALVAGELTGHEDATVGEGPAVALNGRVVAVTRTYDDGRGVPAAFSALLPPQALRRGANRLELFLVRTGTAGPALRVLPLKPA